MDIKTTSGCLFGLAYGDALAAPVEFISSIDEIITRWPLNGPQTLGPGHYLVTDDTQMSLAVGEALVIAHQHGPLSIETVEPALRTAFVSWLRTSDTGAPGLTCIRGCERLAAGVPWYKAGNPSSKGCGANMRVAPVGLLPDAWIGADMQTQSALAQFQAAMTHGHPTALAAADLTAFCVRYLAQKQDPVHLVEAARDNALSQRSMYHSDWLGPLWERPRIESPESYIAQGWDECLTTLDRLEAAMRQKMLEKDPCLLTGAGWVAEEAFGTGLYCFLIHPDDPVAAIRRAALTSGDSDSIACLTGAFAGAYQGMDSWPKEWSQIIEYKERLSRLAEAMAE